MVLAMATIALGSSSCKSQIESQDPNNKEEFKWIVDTFDDIKVLQYKVPDFDSLPLDKKKLIYYLNQAALSGRDIIYDQNFKYNLPIRRTLEAIYINFDGNRESPEWLAFEKYLKKVWFANGIHHHYSNDKFTPEFSETYFDSLIAATPDDKLPHDFGSTEDLLAVIKPIIFDPSLYPVKLNQAAGVDMLKTSAMNYYEGVSQAEAEEFYAQMSNPNDPEPISVGLNSKLVKENGKLQERVWKIGGMYSPAIEKITYWLEKAAGVAEPQQKEIIEALISFYNSGDLKEYDRFNILWVKDTLSNVDFINCFTEVYGDPLGYKASWEAMVNMKDNAATRRTETISENAQWFEDHSPIQDKYKKKQVKGVSAKVINAAILAGDCYPSTPIGINLPNADWIRKEHGSKSVTVQNITQAYAESNKSSGFSEEFILRPEDRDRISLYGTLGDNFHTDLHECLGHGSGQLAPGTKGDELKQYGSTLEEARADLFSLYYLADPKLIELNLLPNSDVYKAQYASYISNGMMTQLARIEPGKNIEEAHMRNRQLIAQWAYELGLKDNVIEKTVVDGKTYIVINDFEKLRQIFGTMLREIQRIKSEGDFFAGRNLVEKYGVIVDQDLHNEVIERYTKLGIQPYGGFVNPIYTPVMEGGEIVNVTLEYPESYVKQMLDYSANYSFLPSVN